MILMSLVNIFYGASVRLQVILGAFMVDLVLTDFSSEYAFSDIQQNFQNLIDSAAKSDARRSEMYRDILKQNVANGQKAFDTVKSEIRATRSRNAGKIGNHMGYQIHNRGNISPAKRETNNDICAHTTHKTDEEMTTKYGMFPFSMNSLKDEEEWIKTYGTHQNDSGVWPLAQYLKKNEDKLKLFCIKAHEKLNNTILKAVDAHVSFWPVTFENRSIEPVWADMIQYSEERPRVSREVYSYIYMIKGNRPDCVFYITEYEQHEDRLTEMVFADHVCGIEGFEVVDTPKKEKKKEKKKKEAKESPLDY